MAEYRHCAHFSNSLPRESADNTIREFTVLLDNWKERNGGKEMFDTFAFSGLSGALIAPTLAHLMHKDLLLIRKNEGMDNSNSSKWVEGNYDAKRVVVIDDLISTGRTMTNLAKGLMKKVPQAEIVGLLLYGSERHLYTPDNKLDRIGGSWYQMKNAIYSAKRQIEMEGLES